MKYRSEIDGLRAFAVLSVVIFHAFPMWLEGGFIGVDVFFVISGFLITRIIFEELDKNTFSFIDFFGRRIRRIFPALILVMVTALVCGWFVLLADEYAQLGKHIASGAAFILNFVLVKESGYFDNVAETKPMLHLWSLAVEEQFYIIWPLMLWLAWKRKFNILALTLTMVLLSFTLNLKFVGSQPTHTFFWPIGRFWELLSGSTLAWLMLYKRSYLTHLKMSLDHVLMRMIYSDKSIANGSIVTNLMSFSGLLILISGVILINEGLQFPGVWALIPVMGALLVIGSGSDALFNRIFLMNPIVVWLGLISYPLYLWHWPILSFLRIVEGETSYIETRIIAVVVSVFLAWLTYAVIEKPIRFSRYKYSVTTVAGVLTLTLGITGYFTFNSKGFPSRNIEVGKIVEAKGDWSYPDGLERIRGYEAKVFTTSRSKPNVAFLGDSHIEQYGPRVVDLYQKGLSREVVFVTVGGCPPIPSIIVKNHKKCANLLENFNSVLRKYPIDTVVIGAAFNGYLSTPEHAGGKYDYYYKDGDNAVSLSSAEGIALAKKSFYNFAKELADRYRVIVLLDIPSGQDFSPQAMLNATNKKRPLLMTDMKTYSSPFERYDLQIQLEDEMTQVFSASEVITIRQSELICPNGLCRALSGDGRPIYKDSGHMRPWFVTEVMDVIDGVLMKM